MVGRRRVIACLGVLALVATARPSGQPAQDRLARIRGVIPEIDRAFVEFADRQHVPGIAYGILVDGVLVHARTHGVRDVVSRAPVTTDTAFRIASMTKSVTALAILKLRDEGRLSLDEPAERYVPELASVTYPTSDSPRITIRHLLTHSAGFPEDNPWGDQQLSLTDDEFTRMMRSGIPFSTTPGVAYEYSNYAFAILGRIVSNVSGQRYASYVQRNILMPLQLTSATLEPADVPRDRLAHGYRWEDERWKEEPPLPDGAMGSMGGMLMSLNDLGRYVGYLMRAWPPRDEPEAGPVRRASLREMQQVARARPATVTTSSANGPVTLNVLGYGYGLAIRQTCEFRHIVSHSGGLPGYGSQMRWLVDEGVGLIALGNLTYTSWGALMDQVTAMLARSGALTRTRPTPSPALLSAKNEVTRLIDTWDDARADRIAAVNLFLDQSRDRRRRQLESLRADVGACRADGPFEVENALRGQWTMACERGALRVSITLAPTMPPTVQYLSVEKTTSPLDTPSTACPAN